MDASKIVMAVHQNHDYSHHPEGSSGVWQGPEAWANRKLTGGGHHLFTLADATHRLTPAGLERNLSGEYFHRRWEVALMAFRSQTRPVRRWLYWLLGHVAGPMKGLLNATTRVALGRSTGTMTADPNPIHASDCPGVGMTTLSWTSRGTTAVEIRVGAPDGPLFSRTGPSGSAVTGNWVHHRMGFYLQDVSGGLALNRRNTLAAVKVYLDE